MVGVFFSPHVRRTPAVTTLYYYYHHHHQGVFSQDAGGGSAPTPTSQRVHHVPWSAMAVAPRRSELHGFGRAHQATIVGVSLRAGWKSGCCVLWRSQCNVVTDTPSELFSLCINLIAINSSDFGHRQQKINEHPVGLRRVTEYGCCDAISS